MIPATNHRPDAPFFAAIAAGCIAGSERINAIDGRRAATIIKPMPDDGTRAGDNQTYGLFVDSTDLRADPVALRNRVKQDGYLFLRGAGPRDKLLKLRRDMLELCKDAGWLDRDAPLMDGKWSGAGPFTEGEQDYMDVYKKVIHLQSFRDAPEDPRIFDLMSKVLNGPVLLHQRKIGRITFPKNVVQTTAAHQDFHYIRGTSETYTVWMPVGDCPVELGGLAVLKSSHQTGFIEHGRFSVKKYAQDGLGPEKCPAGPGVEWQTGDFALGDLILFHSHTIHKAMPNLSADRLRLSIDNRYQRQGESIEKGSMETHYNL
jgi:hypothetical protein